jgi:hypothetical protein
MQSATVKKIRILETGVFVTQAKVVLLQCLGSHGAEFPASTEHNKHKFLVVFKQREGTNQNVAGKDSSRCKVTLCQLLDLKDENSIIFRKVGNHFPIEEA